MEIKDQILMVPDHVTLAGVKLPVEEVRRLFQPDSSFMSRVKRGVLCGEFDRPRRNPGESDEAFTRRCAMINEDRVSHVITNIRMGDDGVVRADIQSSGPRAAVLDQTIQHNFGIRAHMQLQKVDGIKQPVPGTLDIVTFDLISSIPGVALEPFEREKSKDREMFHHAYVIGLEDLAEKASRVMSEREIIMFHTLKRMAEIPEGVNLDFSIIRITYNLLRAVAETTLRHDRFLADVDSRCNDRIHRMHSTLLLVSALQAIELETEGKGEIYRQYDQTRRMLVQSYQREVKEIEKDYAAL